MKLTGKQVTTKETQGNICTNAS